MARVLKIGDRGAEVGLAQQALIEAGEQIDKVELAQAYFGPSTKLAVLDFQASHLDAKGRALVADGVVGPATTAALANPRQPVESFIASGWRSEISAAPCPEAATACAAAIGEISVKEDPPGSNRGPRVDTFTGKEWLGAPWCALFVSWAWAQNPSGSPFGKLASALKIRDWGTKKGKLLPADAELLPGDVGVILRAGGRGHVEIVVAKEFDKQIPFVGGNVGNAVRGTVRSRDQFTCFVRPIR